MIPKPDIGRDPAAPAALSLPRRLVLDTNVCLDLFVFRDPRWAALLSALQRSEVQAYTRADCRMEWTLVLGYARLGLDAAQQAAALAEFDQLISLISDATAPQVPGSILIDAPKLPLCRDPDDQKFIELAAACHADALLSKDKLVLKLARKMKKLALYRILSPEQWTAEWQAGRA
jgi:putative PIN family toxin of toxin-antitoxin system